MVNGQVMLEPFYLVQPNDVVSHENNVLQIEEHYIYLLMNKPRGYITTVSDEKDRKTVLDLIKENYKVRLYPVGRLDRDTSGLLLLTNDGQFAEKMSHPRYEVEKMYSVHLDKSLKPDHLQKIAEGISLEDGPIKVDEIAYIADATKKDIGVLIHSGRNRIVRRIFEHFGYEVVRLDRTWYAGLTKKGLSRGFYRHLTEQEVTMLKHFKVKKGKG